jgi:mandelate racemase
MVATIERIRIRAVEVPMNRPIVSSTETFGQWPILLIDVFISGGVVGHAYLEPYTRTSIAPLALLVDSIGSILTGKALAPLDAHRDAVKHLNLSGRQGMTLIAISGVDMALWDAIAKEAGMPLVRLLGGTPGKVRAYNTCGLWLIPLEKLAAEAKELLAEGGFTALKLRLGRATIAEDREAIHIVREAVGPSVHIMTDFSQGLQAGEAKLRMQALDEEGLYWFEEPVECDDLGTCASLTRQLKTPMMLGENLYGPREWYKCVQEQASDLLMADLGRIGGVTGWLRSAPIAAAAGIPMSNHFYATLSATMLRASQSADWLEYSDWVNPILASPPQVHQGSFVVRDVPGSGVEWDEESVRRYEIELLPRGSALAAGNGPGAAEGGGRASRL